MLSSNYKLHCIMINICEMKSSTVVGIMESLDVSGKGLMTDSNFDLPQCS